MKNLIRIGIVGLTAFSPLAAFATLGDTNGGASATSALTTISNVIGQATPIVIALALLGFFWGLAIYIFNAGDEKKKTQGRSIMIYGILALFIMLSVFGIIGALQATFNIRGSQVLTSQDIPTVQTNTSNSGFGGLFGNTSGTQTCTTSFTGQVTCQ